MNITTYQRFKVKLLGHCYLHPEIREGWKKPLPLYLARCPNHGYFEDYPHGWDSHLNCPECFKEWVEL